MFGMIDAAQGIVEAQAGYLLQQVLWWFVVGGRGVVETETQSQLGFGGGLVQPFQEFQNFQKTLKTGMGGVFHPV